MLGGLGKLVLRKFLRCWDTRIRLSALGYSFNDLLMEEVRNLPPLPGRVRQALSKTRRLCLAPMGQAVVAFVVPSLSFFRSVYLQAVGCRTTFCM